jgi:hypothetical protein
MTKTLTFAVLAGLLCSCIVVRDRKPQHAGVVKINVDDDRDSGHKHHGKGKGHEKHDHDHDSH